MYTAIHQPQLSDGASEDIALYAFGTWRTASHELYPFWSAFSHSFATIALQRRKIETEFYGILYVDDENLP